MRQLRLNIGDASEARIYYLAHYLAAEEGYFGRCGIDVVFTRTEAGGNTAMGGQIGPVVEGHADACVGGPMVTMKLLEQGIGGVVSFCALAQANPWIIAGSAGIAEGFAGLAVNTIIDSGNVTTATLCLRDALRKHGLDGVVAIEPGCGDLGEDLRRACDDPSILVHHSLHALGPDVAAGRLEVVTPMALVTPPVPWSAYIARADRLAQDGELFSRFRDAIAAALRDVQDWPAERTAALIRGHYPDYDAAVLATVIESYRKWGCFSPTPRIARADMIAFASIMHRAGWLETIPSPDLLLASEIAA